MRGILERVCKRVSDVAINRGKCINGSTDSSIFADVKLDLAVFEFRLIVVNVNQSHLNKELCGSILAAVTRLNNEVKRGLAAFGIIIKLLVGFDNTGGGPNSKGGLVGTFKGVLDW